jgi:tRNA dimethylallyltransferase
MALTRFKTAILIIGPTAVGKTSVAIELAQRFSTEIISADSRQCFKELNIGVARPSELELQAVRHYFIASHSIHDNVNAGTFEQYALQRAKELFHTHDQIIVTGGTGLYLQAFCEGLDEIPNVPNETRKEIISKYEKNGLKWLQKQVEKKDPRFYISGEIRNPHRLMRALEVAEATGRSILEFRSGRKETRDFNIVKIGLELPKEELHRNINTRVDRMIDAGLVEEAKQLSRDRSLNALQTVGYKEIFDYLDAKFSIEQAAELIKQNTRQYAKRQMTWFKKDKQIEWFTPSDISRIEKYLVAQIDATDTDHF